MQSIWMPEVSPIDANVVFGRAGEGRILLGSFPAAGVSLAALGVHRLALCAKELQRPPGEYPGVGVYYVPLDDTANVEELVRGGYFRTAVEGALAVARSFARGRTTLVTCAQGRNRSAFVAGLAMRMLSPQWSGDLVVEWLKRHRPHVPVLTNAAFVRCLCGREPTFEQYLRRAA